MATYNAKTVSEETKLEELAHCAEERRVEILAAQEHRVSQSIHTPTGSLVATVKETE